MPGLLFNNITSSIYLEGVLFLEDTNKQSF
jgi:hypothetical protein